MGRLWEYFRNVVHLVILVFYIWAFGQFGITTFIWAFLLLACVGLLTLRRALGLFSRAMGNLFFVITTGTVRGEGALPL